jgi:predicted alpha/beta hydrolase family esterase
VNFSYLFEVENIPAITKQVQDIYIYHSTDDEACPYSHAKRLYTYLPEAKMMTFTDRGHFR